MPVSKEYRAYVLEKLNAVTPVTDRAMFGGVGIYSAGFFFALIDDDRLCLKADDSNREDFESRGAKAWSPYGEPQPNPGYYELPEGILENPQELSVWVDKSVAVAERKKKKK
jgi:DNA transformation protein